MSEFKVCFTTVRDVQPHPNPEVLRLEICTIYGFQVVTKKDQYKIGDVVCYCPIDSVLPEDLEAILFPPDAKIKLSNRRIRQIKIQKFYSQGMLIDQAALREVLKQRGLKSNIEFKLEHNYMELFGITKYEPPVPKFQQAGVKTGRKANCNNPNFHSYNGLTNIKWQPDAFKEGDEVVIQCKLHGTNARAGMLPTQANTIFKKIKKFLGFDLGYEFCYGSNNVELTNRKDFSNNFYGEDVYGKTFKMIEAKNKIKPNEVIYGEIIGAGIQKGYDYGHKDHHEFVLFDVKLVNSDGSFRWLNPEEVEQYAKERGFKFVPVLYVGPFNSELAQNLATGPSVYCSEQRVREGCVVKSRNNYNNPSFSSQKAALKIINPAYLDDKNNTDHH